MALLNMQDVTINMGGQPLLEKATMAVEPGERVAVTGRNGAGKSTLLALLGGQLEPNSGCIQRGVEMFGQMPQNVPQDWSGTVFTLVAEALGEEGRALAAAHTAAHAASLSESGAANGAADGTADAAAGEPANEAAKRAASWAAEQDASEKMEKADVLLPDGAGWERYGEILGVIRHLQLETDADFSSLSGGTMRRVALARALIAAEDLILDEPTNHLDLPTIAWLEDYLIRKARTVIFVSHDRSFVQRLATRIVEVDRGQLYSYECTFDQYAAKREERLEIEERHFALFDKKLAQEEAWIRQGVKARRTRNMGRVRALREMRKEHAARRVKLGTVSMLAQEAERSGKLVIEARDVSFAYPGAAPLFRDFSTIIQRGDRVGIIGRNGSGKSTLIRLLLGELAPSTGAVRMGTNLQISYFDQLRMTLDPEANVMNSVADGNDVVQIGGNTRHVAGYLQDFLFTPDRLRLPVKTLSGGERNRLLLAKLFTTPSNVLVLDEPTNDLDVETLELLEELLADYAGTVLLVSHDRAFLDNLVTSTLALEGDGLVHEYIGAYSDWLRQRNVPEPRQEKKAPAATPKAQPKRKLSYNEQRELEKLEKTLADLPQQLADLEAEQEQHEAALRDPEFFTRDAEGFNAAAARLTALEDEQLELLEYWEATEQRLEELRALA